MHATGMMPPPVTPGPAGGSIPPAPGGDPATAVPAVLLRLAASVVAAIPGADGAGVALHTPEGAVRLTTGEPFVRRVHDAQFTLAEGPCLQAVHMRQVQRSGFLGNDHRWPRFGIRASRMGVNSALSLPLITTGRVLGCLAVYSHAGDAFDDDDERIGRFFATWASDAADHRRTDSGVDHLSFELRTALTDGVIIGRAIGILQVRGAGTVVEASRRLQMMSRHLNSTLVDTASALVDGVGGSTPPATDAPPRAVELRRRNGSATTGYAGR